MPLLLKTRQIFVPSGEPGQASAGPMGTNSTRITRTCSWLLLAWGGSTFPDLIIWRNIIKVLLWPGFKKAQVGASTWLIYISCRQKKGKTISSSTCLLTLDLNTPIPRGLHSSRKSPTFVRSPAIYYFFPSWLPWLQKVLIPFKIQSSFIDISSFAKQLNWSRRHEFQSINIHLKLDTHM